MNGKKHLVIAVAVAAATPVFANARQNNPHPPGQARVVPPRACPNPPAATPDVLAKKVKLGEILFHDNRLSEPAGQSCAYCHSDGSGFNGNGDAAHAVFEGAFAGRFGTRNPPSAAYASFSPPLTETATGFIGGQFWDGRANTLEEQAAGPLLNPVEMGNPDAKTVAKKVLQSSYAKLFREVYGNYGLSDGTSVLAKVADAIAAYERSQTEVNRFSSRYDLYLADPVRYPLTPREANGLALFQGKGRCAACHPCTTTDGSKPLLTDFSYDNLGLPRNPDIPAYRINPFSTDLGLGKVVGRADQDGKFKVPSLRNVGVSPPYGHNGYFTSLGEIVHFYNTRDLAAEGWPAPEVPYNVNTIELGNLGLTPDEEGDIVAFLMTLTDGAAPPKH